MWGGEIKKIPEHPAATSRGHCMYETEGKGSLLSQATVTSVFLCFLYSLLSDHSVDYIRKTGSFCNPCHAVRTRVHKHVGTVLRHSASYFLTCTKTCKFDINLQNSVTMSSKQQTIFFFMWIHKNGKVKLPWETVSFLTIHHYIKLVFMQWKKSLRVELGC